MTQQMELRRQQVNNGHETRIIMHPDAVARVVNEDTRTIRGYGIVFNRESVMLRIAGRKCREVIKPDAMRGVDLSACLGMHNHDMNRLIGNAEAGTMRTGIDEIGVWYEIDVPNSPTGEDVYQSVKRGDTKGSSFQFDIAPDGEKWEQRDGVWYRDVTQFGGVYEMGPVTMPAYPDTTAAARGLAARLKSLRDGGESEGEGMDMEAGPEEMMEPYWQLSYLVSNSSWAIQELNYLIACMNEYMETYQALIDGGTQNAPTFTKLKDSAQNVKSASQAHIDLLADAIKILNNSANRSSQPQTSLFPQIDFRLRELETQQN